MATPRREERIAVTKETIFKDGPVSNMTLYIFRATTLNT
jgi:hypothetical protein